ncbi:MAG: CIA30 family protein [Planctomycetota bacterium]
MHPTHSRRYLAPSLTVAAAAFIAAPSIAGEGCPLCAVAGAKPIAQAPAPSAAEPPATLLTDFTEPRHNAEWQVVNDNVMGGRSIGNLTFQPPERVAGQEPDSVVVSGGTLTFEGFINTNGGGFASVRLPLPADALVDAAAIRLTLQSDFRNVYLRVDDDRPHAGRNINHRAALPLDENAPADAWQTVTVPLDALAPAWRGRSVPTAPALDGEHATRLGLMINDTEDGPFRLVIDRIEIVPRPEPMASSELGR